MAELSAALESEAAYQSAPEHALSSSAAAASAMMREGMSLTDLWGELTNTRKALLVEKQEVERLEEFLKQILEDVERKAPVIQRQRSRLEKSESARQQLTASLEKANSEYSSLEARFRAESARANRLQSVQQHLEAQTADLSHQVQTLLRETVQLRGGVVTAEDTPASQQADISESAAVISSTLVSVRSIEELQQQNVQLRAVVRELSAQHEAAESDRVAAARNEVEGELGDALRQLQSMREARERQQAMVDAIVQQRNMFRALYEEACVSMGRDPESASALVMGATGTPGSHTRATAASGAAASDSARGRDAGSDESGSGAGAGASGSGGGGLSGENVLALRELQQAFEDYKRERRTTDEMINKEAEEARSAADGLRMENAKLTANVDGLTRRHNDLKEALEAAQRECNRLQSRTGELSNNVVSTQGKLFETENALGRTREELRQLQVQYGNLREEKALLEAAERRMREENTSLTAEKRSQQSLLSSLQSIQNEMRRSENDMKARLEHQVDSLEKDCKVLRMRVEEEQNKAQLVNAARERQMQELRDSLAEAQKAHQATREELVRGEPERRGRRKKHGQRKEPKRCRDSRCGLAYTPLDEKEAENERGVLDSVWRFLRAVDGFDGLDSVCRLLEPCCLVEVTVCLFLTPFFSRSCLQIAANTNVEGTRQQLKHTQQQLANAEERLTLLLEGRKKAEAEVEATQEAGGDIDQLQAAMAQIKTLQHDLEQANQSTAQFKAISSASEAALEDLTKNMEAYKKLVEERNNQAKKETEDLRTRLTELEEAKQTATQQLHAMEDELTKARNETLTKVRVWSCRLPWGRTDTGGGIVCVLEVCSVR